MLNGISHLWFLLAIFECYILGKAIEGVLLIPERKRQVLMVMLLLFLILVPYRIPEVRFLCLSRIVTYFPYVFNRNVGEQDRLWNFNKVQKQGVGANSYVNAIICVSTDICKTRYSNRNFWSVFGSSFVYICQIIKYSQTTFMDDKFGQVQYGHLYCASYLDTRVDNN